VFIVNVRLFRAHLFMTLLNNTWVCTMYTEAARTDFHAWITDEVYHTTALCYGVLTSSTVTEDAYWSTEGRLAPATLFASPFHWPNWKHHVTVMFSCTFCPVCFCLLLEEVSHFVVTESWQYLLTQQTALLNGIQRIQGSNSVRVDNFLSSKAPRLTLGLIQPPVQWST
jgi:hypothetical protein